MNLSVGSNISLEFESDIWVWMSDFDILVTKIINIW
jgi:hypothetical protein